MSLDRTKRRKLEWKRSYSSCTQSEAEERIGKRFTDICNNARPVNELLDLNNTIDKSKNIKDEIYKGLCMCIDLEDYPIGNIEPFKEANTADFAFIVLANVMKYYKDTENISSIKLRRESTIVSKDNQTGGREEYIVVDCIELIDRYILVVETKNTNLISCLKQCILALKDCYDNNNDGKRVFGLLTTGIAWQMVTYKDGEISISEEIPVAFPLMMQNKDRWMKDYSLIIDCMQTSKVLSLVNNEKPNFPDERV
ncbi:hypothetical protein HDU92_004511 [Lobulomyces angularis]|nr:hypothetical protein HDU92_004511 [Lobulomyces angularis]